MDTNLETLATEGGGDELAVRNAMDPNLETLATEDDAGEVAACPAQPQTMEELGLPPSMPFDLAVRYLHEHDCGSIAILMKALKLPYAIVDAVFQQLRQQLLIEVKRTVTNDYIFTLTDAAHRLAASRSHACRYCGPAPVPLQQYASLVRSQRVSLLPTRDMLRTAFEDLVIADDILDQLGPALVSGKPIFIYGPPGNGKTSVSERLRRVFDDSILVPYAVEVDGHIIVLFDPAVHEPVDEAGNGNADGRWVRCRRPSIIAGGDLVGAALNLRLDPTLGAYAAPLQMKAANGVLVIDDFGRQAISPRDLLNRWMLPLDRRVDYLSLQYGYTFQIPFELTIVFSTNLEPAELADDAFLRRVPNKVYMGSVDESAFDEIFRRALARRGIPCDPDLAAQLRTICRKHSAELNACYPADICDILAAQSAYDRRPLEPNQQNLARAAHLYFARRRQEARWPTSAPTH
jgi:hypothetical protein